jgi:hypothetical protein
MFVHHRLRERDEARTKKSAGWKEGGKDRQRRAMGEALEGAQLRAGVAGCDTTTAAAAAAAVAAAAAASHMLVLMRSVLVRSAGVMMWCTWHAEGEGNRNIHCVVIHTSRLLLASTSSLLLQVPLHICRTLAQSPATTHSVCLLLLLLLLLLHSCCQVARLTLASSCPCCVT